MTATIFASNIVPNSANSGNKIPTEDSRRTRNGPSAECKVSRSKNSPLQTSATITGPDTLVAGVAQPQQFSLDSVSDANGIDSVTVTLNGQSIPVVDKNGKYTTIIPS